MAKSGAVLLDTCALIWFAQGKLSPAVVEALELANEAGGVFVSPVSAWEIGLIAKSRRENGQVQFLPDPQSWFAALVQRPEIREAQLSWKTALAGSTLPEPLHADPADRMLIATAREMNAALATADEAILACGRAGHVKILVC